MATPYFQVRVESAPSTQDMARELLGDGAPSVVVIAAEQTEGRGREGAPWLTADRALAVSLALELDEEDARPVSLVAGVAAARLGFGIELKWPNDLMVSDRKVGGILVERQERVVVAGLGLNLWWRDPPEGASAIFDIDPGRDRHVGLGALWAAELARLLDEDGWPRDEYKTLCSTLGREITWEPEGRGLALDVDARGALVVETGGKRHTVQSGAVRHVRPRRAP